MKKKNIKSKNEEYLKDFRRYCRLHPEYRFWQALRNWSGKGFIYAYGGTTDEQMEMKHAFNKLGLIDTFYL